MPIPAPARQPLPQPRVGLVSLGLDAYWPQFPGLEQRLLGYTNQVATQLAQTGVHVVNLGLIDSPPKAMQAGHDLRRNDVDLLVIYVTTYALSATVLPMVQRAGVPVLLLNLQPSAAIDYAAFNAMTDRSAMTGEWLAWCNACPLPEIANVFLRAGIRFHQVTGMLEDDPEAWTEIRDWMQALTVRETLSHCRTGLLGHYYSGMLDIVTDLTAINATFGGHFEMLEADELSALRKSLPAAVVEDQVAYFQTQFDVQPDCDAMELARAARTSAALDRWVHQHDLQALAYYYKGTGIGANEDTLSSIILGTSLLTARGLPVAGEYEVKNVIAMKIMDAFSAGGSFSEFYATDFAADLVLLGHDGPGHLAIADGKAKVRPLGVYHGKVGNGLSIEMSVKPGPVTLLSVVEDPNPPSGATGGRFLLLIAQGESVPGPILEIGNTNSRYRFSLGTRGFINAWTSHGPAHHCAIGVGHIAPKLEKLAALLNIRAVQIC
ncbi:MAG: arabinose isomerase [Acidobacteriota bacterium]